MSLQDQLAAQLQAKSLPASQAWLTTFLAAQQQRTIPLAALTKTALFRLLNTDFRESLSPRTSSTLPVDIYDPNVQERRLPGTIPVQVLDIEDIGTSIWSQVEAIERVERGEAVRGREIVRTVNVGDEEQDGTGAGATTNVRSTANANANAGASSRESTGPHRLILQDANGIRAVGIEMTHVKGIAINSLPIGGKLLLQNATVARGMILLTPENVTLLGGKIEAMDQAWKADRKARLLERVTGVRTGTGVANGG
ncbi:OB fold domain-containing protein [Aspergillus undulatus]|uniref:OB fold domain-containing protein n=1 Tax=Aspergillus undulatus TaxID=1810928 RepID=UPI003CCDCCD0